MIFYIIYIYLCFVLFVCLFCFVVDFSVKCCTSSSSGIHQGSYYWNLNRFKVTQPCISDTIFDAFCSTRETLQSLNCDMVHFALFIDPRAQLDIFYLFVLALLLAMHFYKYMQVKKI